MISVIIPTYNESANIVHLIQSLSEELLRSGYPDHEILVMDDNSPDRTCEIAEGIGNPRVRVINRRGKPKGLAYAVIDGFAESKGEILGVMDADLSHPVSAVPALIRAIEQGEWVKLAVGSRYVRDGGIKDWPWSRKLSSKVACWIARPLTSVRDATSGFFFLRKEILKGVSLNPLGFKIGLEVVVKAKHGGQVVEVPFVFTDRKKGESKLNPNIIFCYLKQVTGLMLSGEKNH